MTQENHMTGRHLPVLVKTSPEIAEKAAAPSENGSILPSVSLRSDTQRSGKHHHLYLLYTGTGCRRAEYLEIDRKIKGRWEEVRVRWSIIPAREMTAYHRRMQMHAKKY